MIISIVDLSLINLPLLGGSSSFVSEVGMVVGGVRLPHGTSERMKMSSVGMEQLLVL